jgi:hypothetical protein
MTKKRNAGKLNMRKNTNLMASKTLGGTTARYVRRRDEADSNEESRDFDTKRLIEGLIEKHVRNIEEFDACMLWVHRRDVLWSAVYPHRAILTRLAEKIREP